MTDFVSTTVSYDDGSSIKYSRSDNVVTAEVSPGTLNAPGRRMIPFGYKPAGNMFGSFISSNALNPDGSIPEGTYGVHIDELGLTGSKGATLTPVANAPYLPFSTQWLTDFSEIPPRAPQKYVLNPQNEQDSITAYLREMFPFVPVIEDGIMDGDYSEIKYHEDETVKPFIILWYSQVKRNPRGRSFSNYKLDSHSSTVDVVVVGRNGTIAREILNEVADALVGFRTDGGGRLYKGSALWGDSRQVIDAKNRPSRWARTDRFDFGVSAYKVTP